MRVLSIALAGLALVAGLATAQDETSSAASARPATRRPAPRGPAAGPNYIPTPEEAAAMKEAERIRCGACQFWSPTVEACVAVPLKYDCQGTVAGPALMGCGVECAYFEDDGEHGHCVDIDRDECTAIAPDQYDKDVAALVAKRDAGQIPPGELRLLPPLPPPPPQAAEDGEQKPAEPAAP